MADFCTRCSKDMFSPDTKPDIDLIEEAKDIQEGFEKGPFLCEGCGFIHLINIGGVIRVYCHMPSTEEILGDEEDDKEHHYDLPTLEDFIKLPMPSPDESDLNALESQSTEQ